jgi:CheY-like chemotaxis protein
MSNERTRILVVDDEEIVRESLGGWLEKDGYTIAVAPDGPSALEKLKAERWSILIVDLKMPGMDGLQVLEEAKKILPDLAVVIMTAYATVDTAVAAMKAGAYDYLVKPFDPEELSIMMQKIVSQQTLVRENVVLRQALKQGRLSVFRPPWRPKDARCTPSRFSSRWNRRRAAARATPTVRARRFRRLAAPQTCNHSVTRLVLAYAIQTSSPNASTTASSRFETNRTSSLQTAAGTSGFASSSRRLPSGRIRVVRLRL